MVMIQFVNGLMEGMTLFLIASGLTLIFGVSRIINFAHGSLYMLGAFLTVTGWMFASYLSGEPFSAWRILGSELLVSAVCGLTAYFAAMPIERDLTEELRESDRRGNP